MNAADPSAALADHALGVRYEDLPPPVVASVKQAIIDTAGAGLAGSSAELGRIVAAMVRDNGGAPHSTLWVSGDRLPASEAAFANAVMARCRELDDVHEGSPRAGRGHGGHVNVMIVPAVLAVIEHLPWPVSGRELLAAIAVGGDIMVRLRLAAGDAGRLGWEGPTVSPFGVAAAVGRLLRLDASKLQNAMGAAYAQCSGNVQSTADGTWDVWLNAGLGARAGIVAAELARRGHRGAHAPLLGSSGLYPLYFRGEYHAEALLSELGRHFESGEVSVKPYAACKATHHAIYTTLALVQRHQIDAGAIERIEVRTSDYTMRLAGLNEHGAPKYAPRTINEAQFSIPFTMALAMLKGTVLPDTLTDAALGDPAILALSHKIVMSVTGAKNEQARLEGYVPADIDIHTNDGRVFSGCERHVKGHPASPMTMQEVVDKFLRCAALASLPLRLAVLQAFCADVAMLEQLDDVRAIPCHLAARAPELASG